MGVLLQGFFKKKPNNAVPSPSDGNAAEVWWWDRLAMQANDLRLAGFTAVWLPPVLKAAAGASQGADGYGPFDDYDIGARHQKGTTSTRFGSREQLQRCVAILRANGLDVYLDMVEHQRSGDTTPPFVFQYPGADGTPNEGRFPKSPSNFLPQAQRDPNLGGQVADDFPFGREFAPINSLPRHYVFDNLIAASDWQTRALDVQGYRVDDVKGLSTDFLRPFLESKSMAGKFAVGEFFDGDRNTVNNWILNPNGMQGRCNAFDFPLKFALNSMCNNPGGFDMSSLDGAGLTGISPLNAVTFVENHDTDLNASAIIRNKALGYVYILTSEGYPCVYYRDYSTDPDCYGLKPQIDNLIWIHEQLAAGPTQQRFKSFNIFAYERLGGAHLLVGLNNDPAAPTTITVATRFGSNVALHDYTGHAGDVFTDGNGNATITIPQNNNGLGYVCYSRAGQNGNFAVQPLSVSQDFEGASDLDIGPAIEGKPLQAGRVWCAAGTPISLFLQPVTTDWTNATAILLEVLNPDGDVLAQRSFTLQTPSTAVLKSTITNEGYHALRLTASNTPSTNQNPAFKLSVRYTAPSALSEEAVASSAVITPAGDSAEIGQWSKVIDLANVPIHTHVLPTGKVLFWGRRNPPGNSTATADFPSLNQHATEALIWDPANEDAPARPTGNQPTDLVGNSINLFCSGHAFLPDGRLMVTGGHQFDSQGIDCATIYDPQTDLWTALPAMNQGRWYPTAVTLPNGHLLVSSGQHAVGPFQPPPNGNQANVIPQVWNGASWSTLNACPQTLPLFPRTHVAPDGRVFVSGSLAPSFFLDTRTGNGIWTQGPSRSAGNSEYAPAVMFDVGKIIFIGGGAPTNIVETIDLNIDSPVWTIAAPMKFARRQHNATILPDGTVLVTGGSQGTGFDNLDFNQPVHTAELWSAATGWKSMAPEAVDRCYHSTAVLLPDGRILSAGGGEYAPTQGVSNPAINTHANGQLFSPPYLFKGPRPEITQAPQQVAYGQTFVVKTPTPNAISKISWVRLPSVTHSFDQNQRINFLAFQAGADQVIVTAPTNANVCPPGHYMLFLLDQNSVPSEAAILRITAARSPVVAQTAAATQVKQKIGVADVFESAQQKSLTPIEQDASIKAAQTKPPVVVGITPTCPYGISACWAGAYEALRHLRGVRLIRPIPNADDSTAYVYLEHDGLPDIDSWPEQFASIANGVHIFRGVEITVEGVIEIDVDNRLVMPGNDVRPPLRLEAIKQVDKIQWDAATQSLKPLTGLEAKAFEVLLERVRKTVGSVTGTVTGPLKKASGGYVLEVREFVVV
jgi:galactose oxidase